MPLSFYVKSDNDLLSSVMWTPEKSRDEGIVFCHGWGGGTPYDDLLESWPTAAIPCCDSSNEATAIPPATPI